MPEHVFIVTGASRGLGRALVQQLIGPGHVVLGLSRQAPASPAGLEQWACDLADPLPVAARLRDWLRLHDKDRFASATLVNNAAQLLVPTPLRDVDAQALSMAVRVGLEAPLLLTTAFLDATRFWSAEKRVLHISSGLGRRPMAGAAAYCAIKAGIDHLARTQALEEAASGTGVRVVALGPGVIDTDMQAQLRSADPADFPERETWVQAKAGGRLDTADIAARKVLAYLRRADFGAEPVADLRAS